MKLTFNRDDYESGEGMLTSVWGPSLWHYLHTISFNYPVKPSKIQKKRHREIVMNMKHTLPCSHCRNNLVKNLQTHPLTESDLENRENFSFFMFDLHENINKMLCKRSNVTYDQIRDRYENFRSRCTHSSKKTKKRRHSNSKTKKKKKEKGCTIPVYGKKSKCIIKIVPQDKKTSNNDTFQMDKDCYKKK